MHTIDPIEKADLTLLLGEQWRATIKARGNTHNNLAEDTPVMMDIGRATPPDIPLRPDNLEFVRPGFGVKVGKAGSLSLANVEQWAIDTALDNMARFGYYTLDTAGTLFNNQATDNEQQQQQQQEEEEGEFVMPNRFFDDFVQMACDESKHFKWLNERLEAQGAHYGDLPVHASIWDSCTDTARSALARMAVVHMTIESRGLDVNPATIARFERSGDTESASMLQQIHNDEVTHVQIGHRWFCYLLKRHEGVGATTTAEGKAFGAATSNVAAAGSDNLGRIQIELEDADNDLYEFRQVTPAYAQKEDGTQGDEIVSPEEAQRRKRFQEVVVQYFKGSLKPPFNTVDRDKGGLTRGWYEPLVVVRERTGFKPGTGRRLQSKKDKTGETSSETAAEAQTLEGSSATQGKEASDVATGAVETEEAAQSRPLVP
ncbi:hypothetical protein BGX31_006742 [Mortierella sp. GBA43]|nr:hypothetical protein BGX31_006742 [Mortierella sp. GBA43]